MGVCIESLGLQDVTQFHLTKYYSAADGAEIGGPVLINGTLYQFSSAGFRVKQIVEGEGSEYWIKWRFYRTSILLEGYDGNIELYAYQLDNALVVEYVVNATNGRSLVFRAYITDAEPLYWVNTVIPLFIPDPSAFNMGFVAVELESSSGSGKWTNPSPILGKYLAPKISGDIVPGGTIYDYLNIKNPSYIEYFGFNPPELWEGISYILSHPGEHELETSGSYTLYYNIKYMGEDSTLGYPLPAYTIDYMTSPDFGHGTLVITPNSLIPLQAEVIYAAESPLIPEGASLSFTVTEASLVPCEG